MKTGDSVTWKLGWVGGCGGRSTHLLLVPCVGAPIAFSLLHPQSLINVFAETTPWTWEEEADTFSVYESLHGC